MLFVALTSDRVNAADPTSREATRDALIVYQTCAAGAAPAASIEDAVIMMSRCFLANSVRRRQIARCRQLLDVPQKQVDRCPGDSAETWQELLLRLTGRDVTRCPQCKIGQMETSMEISPSLPAWELPGRGAVA